MRVFGMRLSAAISVLTAALAVAPAAAAQVTQGEVGWSWRDLTIADLNAARAFVVAEDISAVYPDAAEFRTKLDKAMDAAQVEANSVSTFPGYRATLKHFFNSLDDEHAGIAFSVSQTRLFWPGFAMTYVGGRYVTAVSELPDVSDGSVITACDGVSAEVLAERRAVYEGGHEGLDSTRASGALATFIDAANPFLKRPDTCIIGGRSVKLSWRRIYYADYAKLVLPLAGTPDMTADVNWLPGRIAWVRLGYFEPESTEQVREFRKVVAAAPSLRNAKAIVLDVRQNGGGPYNWMMAFLNSLYGQAYTDDYATARLQIRPVYRATPEILDMFRQGDAEDAANSAPQDAKSESGATRGVAEAVAGGKPYFQAAPKVLPPAPEVAPRSPVHARVLVLTDYGCGSVCIGFVDELKRFPGVMQIGTDTFVDNRTGTPMSRPLPGGLASMHVPVMTRDGRARGDNVPQRPDMAFPGEISDTEAVRRWIRQTVLATPPRILNRTASVEAATPSCCEVRTRPQT